MFPSSLFNLMLGNYPEQPRRSQQQFYVHDPFFIYFEGDDMPQRQAYRVPRPPYTNRQYKEEETKPVNLSKQRSVQKTKDQFNRNQGGYWQCEGDEALERKDYLKAIEHYSKAIELSEGTDSSFYKSRGDAYKALKQLDEALKDAIQAIELDDKNIKAHLLCGQVLAEKGKLANDTHFIQTAIIRLTKAMTLCAGQKKNYYEAQLSKYIYRAKKLLWYKEQEIKTNHKRQAINNYKSFLEQNHELNEYQKKEALKVFLDAIGDPDVLVIKEVPEYLICRITLDLMENPVVTESGHTYERDVLQEHFDKNGAIDPTTRKPISAKYFPNVNVKKATEEFLLKNPWSFEFKSEENYRDIEF